MIIFDYKYFISTTFIVRFTNWILIMIKFLLNLRLIKTSIKEMISCKLLMKVLLHNSNTHTVHTCCRECFTIFRTLMTKYFILSRFMILCLKIHRLNISMLFILLISQFARRRTLFLTIILLYTIAQAIIFWA